MDAEKFKDFIKELRNEKKISQEQLANDIYVSRTTITKWENGKSIPDPDKYSILCDYFNLTLEELISSERKTKRNSKELSNTLLNFINKQFNKNKRLSILVFINFIFIILILLGFSVVYYFNNFNSIRFYTYSGSSYNFEINDGLLILSKDKIYFTLGNISPKYNDNIIIYSIIDNQQSIIYDGDPFYLISDEYGYSSIIDYKKFEAGKQKIYIELNSEKIELILNYLL